MPAMHRRHVPIPSAGHPFRRALPPGALAVAEEAPARDEDKDWKLFLLSFAAFFVCFYTFIF
jgi:hypothetical protein